MFTASVEEQVALVALLTARPDDMSWPDLTRAVRECGSAECACAALVPEQLFLTDEQAAVLEQAKHDVQAWAAEGLTFLSILDDRYPAPVRDIHQAPPYLFARGQSVSDDVGVSVVGSRKASEQGLRIAHGISRALVKLGVSVLAWLPALTRPPIAPRSTSAAGLLRSSVPGSARHTRQSTVTFRRPSPDAGFCFRSFGRTHLPGGTHS